MMDIKGLTLIALTVLFASAWIVPTSLAGEHDGGVRKPCKPPKCGKVINATKNEVAIESVEIKPTENASGNPSPSGLPTQRGVPKLSNDDFNPGPGGHPRKLSNDEQLPGVRKLSNDEQFPVVKH